MRIHYPVIANYSGADVYFQNLAKGIAARGAQPELRFYPHLLEFLPYSFLKLFLHPARHCDLVHSKAEYGWLFASADKPLVVTLAHSVFDPAYQQYKSPLQRLYHDWKLAANVARSLPLAARVVTVSRFSQQRIQEKFGRDDVRVIYNGVDENFFRPLPMSNRRADKPVRLFFAGNLTRRKGADLLPQILARLGADFVLEYTSGLRTHARSTRAANLHPLGYLSPTALVEAYNRCDIFLFPSRLEGFGYPVAEAMACGKPVVATNYSSLPELVDAGQGGLLCPRDDIDAFVESIHQLAANPDRRLRMGAYNRAKVERLFSLRQTVDNYLQLYQELV